MATNINRGKAFEIKVKEDLLKIPDIDVERLPDQMTGFKGTSKNVSDFEVYLYPNLYFIECKTTHENTFPLSGLSQYDKLLEKKGKKGVRSGVVLWFIKHDKVVYVPIATFEKLKTDGKKSVNIKMLEAEDYRIIIIPSVKKRVFMDSDYSILKSLQEGD